MEKHKDEFLKPLDKDNYFVLMSNFLLNFDKDGNWILPDCIVELLRSMRLDL